MDKTTYCFRAQSSYGLIKKIQRRLALPLHKDDKIISGRAPLFFFFFPAGDDISCSPTSRSLGQETTLSPISHLRHLACEPLCFLAFLERPQKVTTPGSTPTCFWFFFCSGFVFAGFMACQTEPQILLPPLNTTMRSNCGRTKCLG